MQEWHQVFKEIQNYIVKIITPQGHGTGFLIASHVKAVKCVATAAHVIYQADYWQQPIRIQHAVSKKEIFIRHDDRVIHTNQNRDTSSIIFQQGEIEFPDAPPSFTEEGKHLKIGVDIGWVGFPAISPDNLCFFNGRISCWIQEEACYLVDGVAINGVSGGPAFAFDKKKFRNIGLVSDYIPNQTAGIAMPGLCVIRDISHARETAQQFESLEDAREKTGHPE